MNTKTRRPVFFNLIQIQPAARRSAWIVNISGIIVALLAAGALL